MLSSQIKSLGTVRGKASDLGSSWLLAKNPNFSKDYLDALARVTPADLQRVAREYLRDDRLNVTSLNPIGSLPKADDAKAAEQKSAVKKFVLSNGLRLLVCENAKLPVVSITAAFRSGLLAETAENNGITKLLSLSMLKGTKTRSASQISEQIESVGGSIGADSGYNSFSASIEVMKPDLSLGLDLMADVLRNPTFPESEVELEKKSQLAGIKAEDEQITAVARNTIRQKIFGAHPYALRSLGSPESVGKITSKDLQAFHDQYAVAKNGVIAVFGDVKAEEVLKLVEKNFGAMPPGELAFSSPQAPVALTAAANAVEERDKQQAVVMVGYSGADILSPDRTALELISVASNDLGSRFFDRIREQLGLAYFVGSGNFNGLAPGCFLFYLGTDPKKVEKVTAEFTDEINKLAKEGLTPEELARAKKKLLGSEAIRNQSNAAFAANVAGDELMGLGFDNYLKRKNEVESVSLEDARRATEKYLNTPARVEVIVRPPEKTAATKAPLPQS